MNLRKSVATGGCALLMAGGGLVPSTPAAFAAGASAAEAEPRKTTCSFPMTLQADCASSKKNRTFGWFDSDGDDIGIVDHYRNGRSTKLLLKVEGYKVKRFSSKGDSMRTINLNFPEDRMVRVAVCTSWSKKAKCSGWSKWSWT